MKKQLPSETAIVVPVLARLSRSLAVFTLLLLTFPMLLARPALAEHRTLDVDAARPGSPQQYTVTDLRIGWSSGINASGQVVGSDCSGCVADLWRALLWSDGVITDLGTLPDYGFLYSSFAGGINDSGQVVGSSGRHAFLWSDGVMSDLNDLIPPDSGWVLFSAAAINDAGQIVGSGSHNGGRSSAFLLTPIK